MGGDWVGASRLLCPFYATWCHVGRGKGMGGDWVGASRLPCWKHTSYIREKILIEIVAYNERWPVEFQRISAPLREALGELALRIDHIGSTSVPGLAAKDIIDVQVTVAALDAASIARALAPLGYTLREDITDDHVPPGRNDSAQAWQKLYFRAPAEQRPTHLHVRQAGRANQRYALLFRDYLRADPHVARAYEQIKLALARLHPEDIEAYYDIKDPACDLIMAAAERWAAQTNYKA
ncbi:MAG TPA: GrpB family protein [Ktedonobacteraceae bacterium]|nr:GrpB family protein [Ktedonobacteraceae bacterium]